MSQPANHVIIVNEKDEWLGTMEKLQAHQQGVLHRAFSIFVFNSNNELLLQQRAFSKYHSGGLWTNTCCSHPMPGESTIAAANRRLKEEMGFECKLDAAFNFCYKADVGNGLIEHEYDHVFIGHSDNEVLIRPDEVNAYKHVSIPEIKKWIQSDPEEFTPWFHLAFNKIVQHQAASYQRS